MTRSARRVLVTLLLAGLVTALVAGCADAAHSVPASSAPAAALSSPDSPASKQGTAASNKALAERDRHLLSLARLPSGAVTEKSGPPALNGPAVGTQVVSSMVDDVRYWRLPMSFATARTWLLAHPPAGLAASGSGSMSGPGGLESTGYSYAAAGSRALAQAELDESLAPQDATHATLRLDGFAVWLDPRPARDDAPGKRLRLTIAHGCQSGDRGIAGVTNSGTGLGEHLLPAGRPTAALVCRYEGLNGHPFVLTGHHLLPAAAAARLAAAARARSLAHVDGGVTNCPAAFGTAVAIAIGYAGRPDVDLWYSPSGCPSLANGVVSTGTVGNFAATLATALH